jgi:hypothetical protein
MQSKEMKSRINICDVVKKRDPACTFVKFLISNLKFTEIYLSSRGEKKKSWLHLDCFENNSELFFK